MRNRILTSVFMIAALLALALPAAARQSDDKPRVGAGLSFLHDEGETAVGVAVDVAKPIRSMTNSSLSLVGDVGINKFNGFTVFSLLGGPRITWTSDAKVHPYAQFLVGLEHCCEENAFTLQPGGGIDYMYNEKMAIRAAIDFRIARYGGQNFNETRFWFGVSTKLGSN